MKITNLNLERYGIYEKESWSPSITELNVVMGENESGKTTLLRFIRDMLFGYGRGKWKNKKGSMTFQKNDGHRYQLYRNEKEYQLLSPQGIPPTDENWSDPLWNGITRAMYEEIFAVGLEDLQGTSFLSQDSVRSRFFMLQGGEKVAEVKSSVASQRENLFIPSHMGKRKINLLLSEAEQIRVQVDALSGQEKNFAELQSKQKILRNEIAILKNQIDRDREQSNLLEKRLGAWEYYCHARDIKQKLALTEDVTVFPSNIKEQWNKLVHRMKSVREQIDALKNKVNEYTPKTREEVIPWASLEDTLEQLYVQVGQWRQTISDAHEIDLQLADWKEHHVDLGLSLSLWGRSLGVDESCILVNWDDGRALAQSALFQKNEIHFWMQREPKVEVLTTEDISNNTFPSEKEWRSYEEQADTLETAIHREKELAEEKILREKHFNTHKHTFWLWFSVGMFAATVAGIAGFYMSLIGFTQLYGVALMGMLTIFSFMVHRYIRKRRAQAIVHLQNELSAVSEQKKTLSSLFGIHAPKEEQDLSVFHNFLQKQRGQFYQAQSQRQANAWKAETIKKQQEEHDAWTDEGKQLSEDCQNAESAWIAWLHKNGLPDADPEKLSILQEQWQKIYSSEGIGKILSLRADTLHERLRHLEEQAQDVISAAGVGYSPTPDAIIRIYEEHGKRVLLWQSVSEKNEQHTQYVKEKEKWEEEWKSCERGMESLFHIVKAQNADEFADKINAYEHRDQLFQEWKQIKQNLRLYAGSEESFRELWSMLETGQYDRWMEEHKMLNLKIAEKSSELERKQKEDGATENEIFRLANDDTVTEVLQKAKEKEAEISFALEKWLTYVYTDYLLKQTQEQYEAGKQPKILQQANFFLSEMTDGKYILSWDENLGSVSLTDSEQHRTYADIWSSGTGDQVYLAVRLAMAFSFGKEAEPLPIVLDDIFVRFDETRQRKTLRFLMDLGKKQQIFLFTCHAQTMKIAEEVGKEKQAGFFTDIVSGRISQRA